MSDFLDLQGAKDLSADAIHLSAVANSVDPVTGVPIDTHTNRVGGTDYTLRGFWDALGPVVMPWTSVTGGTLTQPNQAFLHPANGNYYSWTGAFPKIVAPGSDPAAVGSGYVPQSDVVLRNQLSQPSGGGLIGYYESVAAMRLSSSLPIGAMVKLISYHTGWAVENKLPIGGGEFVVTYDSTTPDDGGMVFVNASGQRLKRVFTGRSIHASWFGARGNGTDQDQGAINAALVYANSLTSVSTGNNKHIGGADVILFGNHLTTAPIIFPNDAGGIGLVGDGGASISTNHTSGAYEGGYSAGIIVGRQSVWASGFGSCTWRNRIHNIKMQKIGGVSCYGIVVSGVRDISVRDVQIDGQFVGMWVENCSESVFDRIFTVGCAYGLVNNGRYNHRSPLGFDFGTNDVSNNNYTEISHRNPIICGTLQMCTRQNRYLGQYVGLWGSGTAPTLPSSLALPSTVCAVHINNSVKGDTYECSYDGFIFESKLDANYSAFLVTIPGKAFPTHGLTFKNCYLQVYAADYSNNIVTTLFDFNLSSDARIANIKADTCGCRYQDASVFYPRFGRMSGARTDGLFFTIVNPVSPFMLTTSNLGNADIKDKVEWERVDMEASGFGSTNWALVGGSAKSGTGTNGIQKVYTFTGATTACYMEKTFSGSQIRNDKSRLGLIYVQFKHSGDVKPYINFYVNSTADTDSDIAGSTNNNRYGNVMVDYLDTSGVRTVVFNPFSAGSIALSTLRIRIGKGVSALTSNYVDISDVIVGFMPIGTMPYMPTA